MTLTKRPTVLINLESAVSKATGISFDVINGSVRDRKVVEARHIIWYIAHTRYNFGYSHIGHVYEKKHSTVRHAVRRLKDDCKTEEVVESIFKKYKLLLKPPITSVLKTTDTWAI